MAQRAVSSPAGSGRSGADSKGGAPKPGKQQYQQAGASPRSLLWLQGLLCGGLVTLATPTALLVGVLFLPAIIAITMDRQPGKPIARSVALFGFCGIVGPVISLWLAGHTIPIASTLAMDMNNVLLAWGAAATGWVLAELSPIAVRAVLEALALSRAARLRAERVRYEAEWGFNPAPEEE